MRKKNVTNVPQLLWPESTNRKKAECGAIWWRKGRPTRVERNWWAELVSSNNFWFVFSGQRGASDWKDEDQHPERLSAQVRSARICHCPIKPSWEIPTHPQRCVTFSTKPFTAFPSAVYVSWYASTADVRPIFTIHRALTSVCSWNYGPASLYLLLSV